MEKHLLSFVRSILSIRWHGIVYTGSNGYGNLNRAWPKKGLNALITSHPARLPYVEKTMNAYKHQFKFTYAIHISIIYMRIYNLPTFELRKTGLLLNRKDAEVTGKKVVKTKRKIVLVEFVRMWGKQLD